MATRTCGREAKNSFSTMRANREFGGGAEHVGGIVLVLPVQSALELAPQVGRPRRQHFCRFTATDATECIGEGG